METLTLVREREGRTEVWEITWAGLSVEIASGTAGRPLTTRVKNFTSPRDVETWLRSELDRQLKAGFRIAEQAPQATADDDDDDEAEDRARALAAALPPPGKGKASTGPAVAKRKAVGTMPERSSPRALLGGGALRVMVAEASKGSAPGTRLGGMPMGPASMDWPDCKVCDRPMLFVGQFLLRDLGVNTPGLLTVWNCTSTGERACASHQPGSGATQALVLDEDDLIPMLSPPSTKAITLARVQTLQTEPLAGKASQPVASYVSTLEARREVVGLIGGAVWATTETIASCPQCKTAMKPLFQLEAHGGGGLGVGTSGRGYAQWCSACSQAAWFVQRR